VISAWSPQPGPQSELLAATWVRLLFFGGARGGGKTDGGLGDYLQDVERYHRHWQGIVFRESYPELQGIIQRSHNILTGSGAEWKEAKHQWNFPNGACLKFRHIENERAAGQYQGHQYPWMLFEELAKWPSPKAFDELKACNRWAEIEIPTKRIRATGNPGGAGHHWIKERFIDPAPLGNVPFRDPKTEWWTMYIPSRVQDNLILLLNDPDYVNSLKGVGSEALVRAWLDGDWSAITGAYYPEFQAVKNGRPHHVIAPKELPPWLTRFRCFDWGSSKPYCCLWVCVMDGTIPGHPAGQLIVYKELYGASEPDVGLKHTIREVADRIRAMDGDDDIQYSVCDPAMLKQDGGPSMIEEFRKYGVVFRAADNSRIPGWIQVRARLKGHDDVPMAQLFSTATNLIRTLPALQHDPAKPEDVDTDSEDHAADAFRYGCMSRPYTMPKPKSLEPMRGIERITMDEAWRLQKTEKSRW
jgi:hypothetical protein